jgi:hypothetical protein
LSALPAFKAGDVRSLIPSGSLEGGGGGKRRVGSSFSAKVAGLKGDGQSLGLDAFVPGA